MLQNYCNAFATHSQYITKLASFYSNYHGNNQTSYILYKYTVTILAKIRLGVNFPDYANINYGKHKALRVRYDALQKKVCNALQNRRKNICNMSAMLNVFATL